MGNWEERGVVRVHNSCSPSNRIGYWGAWGDGWVGKDTTEPSVLIFSLQWTGWNLQRSTFSGIFLFLILEYTSLI